MADWAGNIVDKIEVFKEEKPLLYDAKARPLVRPIGFQAAQSHTTQEAPK